MLKLKSVKFFCIANCSENSTFNLFGDAFHVLPLRNIDQARDVTHDNASAFPIIVQPSRQKKMLVLYVSANRIYIKLSL